MGDYVVTRAHFFDAHLRATADAGARQMVLLGSGLDVRAFRMPWPRGTRIFEIDSAEVHAFKDELLARSDLRPAERVTISSDRESGGRCSLRPASTTPGRRRGSSRAAPGPGVPRAEWDVTESTFAAHAALIDRRVPDHWDPRRGGENMWMFHAVHRSS
jgi:hypothetical protein